MSSKKGQKSDTGPLMLFIAIVMSLPCPSYASGSGYYEIPEGRPPAAFDTICCCRKESDTEEQELYGCHHVEGESCPEGERHYKVSVTNCPSSLLVKKLAK